MRMSFADAHTLFFLGGGVDRKIIYPFISWEMFPVLSSLLLFFALFCQPTKRKKEKTTTQKKVWWWRRMPAMTFPSTVVSLSLCVQSKCIHISFKRMKEIRQDVMEVVELIFFSTICVCVCNCHFHSFIRFLYRNGCAVSTDGGSGRLWARIPR